MTKIFNTSATCNPKEHYMVDTTQKMKVFERLINNRNYFTINYARQFGKSTSLNWILRNMSDRYLVVPISFENTDKSNWLSTKAFYEYFCKNMAKVDCGNRDVNKFWADAQSCPVDDFVDFSDKITEFCKSIGQKVVLTIDEVDKSLDNQLFLNFLSMLRNMYLDREKYEDYKYTFWSVVLAGVYDVKSMKVKIRPGGEHRYNSPWNVAAEYDLDMTFSPQEICTMLVDYEKDWSIGFDIGEIASEIYKYTSGYPVLVSGICKVIDERLDRDWTKDGVLRAVKTIIKDTNATIFQTLIQNIETYPELKKLLRAISLEKFRINYYAKNMTIDLGRTLAFLRPDENSQAQVHNLIFQQVLNDYFIAENQINSLQQPVSNGVFIDKNGDLNMPLIINRFKDLVSKKHDKEEAFLEREGRFMFICFLKPIINGTGFYYCEPENDDSSRMDLVVTYNRKEYVVELKIWHGTEYEISGRDQLSTYLEARNLPEGFLVTFSFLKGKTVQVKPEWIEHNGKRIYEAVV